MEDGSLLPSALRHMKQLRENEERFEGDAGNALLISIFSLNSIYDAKYDETMNRKKLLQSLALLHSIIHSKLIPSYNKRYPHRWFSGGEGLSFGLHCKDDPTSSVNSIPHLRARVSYGPHPLDEIYAIAMMKCISNDLLQYNMDVAIECWDVDDGQILLIEGSEYLPAWVDDEIGVEAMAHRVYIVHGIVNIIPPSIISNDLPGGDYNKYVLSRREALDALIQCETNHTYTLDKDGSLIDFNAAIKKRIAPFCKAISCAMDESTRRSILKESLHTAAIVLPLHLAIMIRYRPDLVATAIASFCQHTSEENNKMPGIASDCEEETVSFENLVHVKIIMPKTLYAMLLSGAGHLPPPIRIPKHYKSMELNRIKRKCKNGGKAYAHFRHALEAGVRLALGFEWLIKSDRGKSAKTNTKSIPVMTCTSEERIMQHIARIDVEAGGDAEWIKSSWMAGPNATDAENDIGALVNCPVFHPEIVQGGMCPISDGGKSVIKHVLEAFKYAKKKDLSSKEISKIFPVPRASEVDPDDWIDLNSIDELENKMNEVIRPPREGVADNDRDEEKMMAMDRVLKGLEKFVSGSGDLEGVSSTSQAAPSLNPSGGEVMVINENVYLTILHRMLLNDPSDVRFDDIVVSSDTDVPNENCGDLIKYFSKEDLDWDDDDALRSEDGGEMKAIMRAMDEQLSGADLDRQFRVPGADEQDNVPSNGLDLPHDDSTVIKANVLSNLLESLDAQEGSKGPIQTMLTEISASNNSE